MIHLLRHAEVTAVKKQFFQPVSQQGIPFLTDDDKSQFVQFLPAHILFCAICEEGDQCGGKFLQCRRIHIGKSGFEPAFFPDTEQIACQHGSSPLS